MTGTVGTPIVDGDKLVHDYHVGETAIHALQGVSFSVFPGEMIEKIDVFNFFYAFPPGSAADKTKPFIFF